MVSDWACTPPTAQSTRIGPVQDAEAPLHLDGEIDVAGGVDEVDAGVAPGDGGGGAGDGDAAFLLQLHVVHGGAGALAMHLLHAMDPPRVIEDALAQGGLARVDARRMPILRSRAKSIVCRKAGQGTDALGKRGNP